MLTGSTEGDGRRVEPGGDVGRRLDVEHDELAVGAGAEAEVVERPPQRVHALLAAFHRHHHAGQVAGRHGDRALARGPSRFSRTPPASWIGERSGQERWIWLKVACRRLLPLPCRPCCSLAWLSCGFDGTRCPGLRRSKRGRVSSCGSREAHGATWHSGRWKHARF